MSDNNYQSPTLTDMTDYAEPEAIGFVVFVGAILAVINVAAAVNVAVVGVLAAGGAMFSELVEVQHVAVAIEQTVSVRSK